MICESEKVSLQTQLLNMQTDIRKCACDEKSVEKRESLKAHKEHNTIKEFNVARNGCMSKFEDTPRKSKDDIITIDSVSKLLRLTVVLLN